MSDLGSNEPASEDGLQNALTELTTALQASGKQKKAKAAEPVKRICSHAYQHGLSEEPLDTVIDIVVKPNGLDQASLGELIRNLYPAGKITSDIVIKVVGSLGQGASKASASVQVGLLKWLIMVYNLLENAATLSKLYGVLFNMLDMLSLRKPLCHVLALITRRRHVRPFRIQMLLELARTTINEPALVGLLRVYKDYYPDIVVGVPTSGRASYFAHPNPEWHAHLLAVQEASVSKDERTHQTVGSSFKVVRNGVKRSKASVVPELHTSYANENSVTFEEIETVDDLVDKLHKLELPNQMASVLADPLLQKYLAVIPSDTAARRVHNWLAAFFDEQLELMREGGGQMGTRQLEEVLEAVLKYTQYTKIFPASCEGFLRRYLVNWDAVQSRKVILELASHLSSHPFDELLKTYFTPIEAALLDETTASKTSLLEFYTSVLRNRLVQLLATREQPNRQSHDDTFSRLAAYTDPLCLSILESAPDPSPTLTAPVLTHYTLLATSAASHPHLIRIYLPPAPLVYNLLLLPNLSSLSGTTALLASYKRAFEAAMAASPAVSYRRAFINEFNALVIDAVNLLWRNRALNADDPNARACLAPEALLPPLRAYAAQRGHALPAMWSVSVAPALCAVGKAAFEDMVEKRAGAGAGDDGERQARVVGPVTQRSLTALADRGGVQLSWAEYRLGVLEWLEGKGVGGLSALVQATVKNVGSR